MRTDGLGWLAEESTSLLSESMRGVSVVMNSNSVGQMSSVQPLPLPEPLVSSPVGPGRKKEKSGKSFREQLKLYTESGVAPGDFHYLRATA